jgi:uncharacterized repeat protein (TIGR01451 family)
VRRIHIAMLALGLVGGLGVTLTQTAAQPAAASKVPGGPAIPILPGAPPADGAGQDLVLPALPNGPEIKLPPGLPDPVVVPPAVPPAAGPAMPPVMPPAVEVKLPLPPAPPTSDIKPAVDHPPIIRTGTPDVPKADLPKVEALKPELPKPEPAKPLIPDSPPIMPPTVAPSAPATATGPSRAAPNVVLETIVPDAVPLGKDISYEIVVKNAGVMAVTGVKVEEVLPVGARLLSADPMPEVQPAALVWPVGDLAVGAEKRLKLTVKPAGESDYQTSPKMTYTAAAGNLVKIVRPKLAASVTGPEAVLINEEAAFVIQVKNEGTGPASKVKIHVALPAGLRHPQQRDGSPVEAELPALAAGETKSVTLKVKALEAGPQTCELTVHADSCGAVKSTCVTTVQKPMLEARLASPGKAMVRGEPTFTLEVANPGNAATPNVMAAVKFPDGLEFVSASDGGNYEPGNKTITWNLGTVAANGKKPLTFKLRAGFHGKLEVTAVAASPAKVNDQALAAKSSAMIEVEGVAAIGFEVVNVDNPAEVGKEVTYEVRIVNQGTRPLTNVKLAAALSDGLTVTNVSGPVKHQASGQTIGFEPIPRLAVKADVVIRMKVKGTTAGDLRCKVQLVCDQLKQPVVKEESTVFFSPTGGGQ